MFACHVSRADEGGWAREHTGTRCGRELGPAVLRAALGGLADSLEVEAGRAERFSTSPADTLAGGAHETTRGGCRVPFLS